MALLNKQISKYLYSKTSFVEKMSSLRCQMDSEKVQLTFQILTSVIKSLDRGSVSPLVIVVCPFTMFCISWVATYVANGAAENLICSWNYHMIPGPQGCHSTSRKHAPTI